MRLPAPVAFVVAGGSYLDALCLLAWVAIAGIVLGPYRLLQRLPQAWRGRPGLGVRRLGSRREETDAGAARGCGT